MGDYPTLQLDVAQIRVYFILLMHTSNPFGF